MPFLNHPHHHPYYSANAHREPTLKHWRDSGCPALGHAIAKARIDADMKQDQVAAKLGVSRSRIAQWESAKRPVPWEYIEALKGLFGTQRAWHVQPYATSGHAGMFARMAR